MRKTAYHEMHSQEKVFPFFTRYYQFRGYYVVLVDSFYSMKYFCQNSGNGFSEWRTGYHTISLH